MESYKLLINPKEGRKEEKGIKKQQEKAENKYQDQISNLDKI